MPTETTRLPRRLASLAALLSIAALAPQARAEADDSTPFYAGGSLGVTHLSNVFRRPGGGEGDTVVSAGLLAGLDKRLGRQHLTLDGSLQHNRYADNRELDNQSYTLRTALKWQTVGRLSGTLSASSSRALADFNIGGGVVPIFEKNLERNDEYAAVARLGTGTRYSLEGGWTHRRRDFSAAAYNRFVYNQDTAHLGLYATPGGNVRLGLVGRHTEGRYPRYPVLRPGLPPGFTANDYQRDDIDFTTHWSTGGSSSLYTRLSRSRLSYALEGLRDFSGTTGAVGWDWQPTGKIQLGLQYSRDTGQETMTQGNDVNRLYTSWRLKGSYALTGKISLNANASRNRSRRSNDPGALPLGSFDNDKLHGVGVRWAITRGISLNCQYNRSSRDSSVPQYAYSASSYGCTAQAIVF